MSAEQSPDSSVVRWAGSRHCCASHYFRGQFPCCSLVTGGIMNNHPYLGHTWQVSSRRFVFAGRTGGVRHLPSDISCSCRSKEPLFSHGAGSNLFGLGMSFISGCGRAYLPIGFHGALLPVGHGPARRDLACWPASSRSARTASPGDWHLPLIVPAPRRTGAVLPGVEVHRRILNQSCEPDDGPRSHC